MAVQPDDNLIFDDWDDDPPRPNGPMRDGGLWVLTEKCATCIFRPGNLMHLRQGTVEQMVEGCVEDNTVIPCHETLDGPRSVCRGFYDVHRAEVIVMRMAAAFEALRFDEPPKEQDG